MEDRRWWRSGAPRLGRQRRHGWYVLRGHGGDRAGRREGKGSPGREPNPPNGGDGWPGTGRRRPEVMLPGGYTDDGGLRPWAYRPCDPGRGAPPVLAVASPCPGRGEFGQCG